MVDAPGAIDPGTLRGEIDLEGVWFSYGAERRRRRPTSHWALRDVDLTSRPARPSPWSAPPAPASRPSPSSSPASTTRRRRVLVDGHDLRERPAARAAAPARDRPPGGLPLLRQRPREHRLRAAGGEPGGDRSGRRHRRRRPSSSPACPTVSRPRSASAASSSPPASASSSPSPAPCSPSPAILILDEATSNVDVRTEKTIEKGLERLLQGRTAIVIAHRLSTIRRAGKIVVLDGGEIAEQGTHDELIAAGGVYARLYGAWSESSAA